MRCQARIVLPGMAPIRARTLDVSLGGTCVIAAEQLQIGQSCDVGFEAPLNGKMVVVIAAAKVIYCILSGTDGYRIGLQFTQLDAANNKTLAELML